MRQPSDRAGRGARRRSRRSSGGPGPERELSDPVEDRKRLDRGALAVSVGAGRLVIAAAAAERAGARQRRVRHPRPERGGLLVRQIGFGRGRDLAGATRPLSIRQHQGLSPIGPSSFGPRF